LALSVSPTTTKAENYPQNLFSVTQLDFDSFREACGLDCILRKPETKDLITGLASAFGGIDPGYLRLALESTMPTVRQDGEESFYDLPFPKGYAYCSARASITSIMAAHGHSTVDVKVFRNHAGVYTHTPNPGPTEGQSSVEGSVQVIGIDPAYFDEFKRKGVCKDSPIDDSHFRQILACTGNPCDPQEDTSTGTIGDVAPDLKKPPSRAGFGK